MVKLCCQLEAVGTEPPLVNTRGIYLRLKSNQSDPDNITLCPILDMANHSSHLPHMSPRPPTTPLRSMTFISPAEVPLKADEQVYLKYGSHSNRILFSEYGFLLPITAEAMRRGEMDGELDIFDFLQALFSRTNLDFLKGTLEVENYWG